METLYARHAGFGVLAIVVLIVTTMLFVMLSAISGQVEAAMNPDRHAVSAMAVMNPGIPPRSLQDHLVTDDQTVVCSPFSTQPCELR